MVRMSGRLLVEFCGEEHALEPGGSLSFGRAGDLCIDDNPYLHRVVGRLHDRDGTWWLEHLGRHTPVVLRDAHGPSTTTLAPGAATALGHPQTVLTFRAGPTRYEVHCTLEAHEWAVDLLGPEGLDGTTTLDWGRVELNDDQRLLLLAMCEGRLRDPARADGEVLTNRQGARRLGWSLPKFTRKLDHLCQKLHRAGVAGVHGDLSASASDRRRHLVEHALAVPLVTVDELDLLEDARPAA